MSISNYRCCICGGPDDPDEDQVVIIPRHVAHKKCFDKSGLDVSELANRLPCCQSKVSLQSFGGHLLMRRSGIPSDEVWLANATTKEMARYRIAKDGFLMPLESPTGE